MNLGVNAPVHRVPQNVGLKKFRCRVVGLVGLHNQPRQPVFVLVHPAGGAGREGRCAFFRARIGDAVLSKVCASHLLRPISSMPTRTPSFSDSSASAASRFCSS